jgi:hypothetical protein
VKGVVDMPTIIPQYKQVLDGYNIMELSKYEYELIISGLKRIYELEAEQHMKLRERQAECSYVNIKPELQLVGNTMVRIQALISELEGGLKHGKNSN